MKRLLAMLLALTVLLALAACGDPTAQEPDAADPLPPVESETAPAPEESPETAPPTDENPPEAESPVTEETGAGETQTQTSAPQVQSSQPAAEAPGAEAGPRILIAYFTWAENTHVEDPSAVDVDATTSASVLLPGNAAKMAGWVQQEVGGDLFSIVVEEPYSSDYDECLDRAADEKADNARPALVNHVEDMSQYDVVFLGFPNWWYTLPMAVLTFVEEYDFSGKTIVPFVTHGTGGLASTIRDLTAALPADVTVLDPIGVYRPEVDASQNAVQTWARDLDLDNN